MFSLKVRAKWLSPSCLLFMPALAVAQTASGPVSVGQMSAERSLGGSPITPELAKLIGEALASYPSIRARESVERASQSEVDAAKWQRFPTPSVSVEAADASKSDINYRGDQTVLTMRLQQPLWAGGRIRNDIRTAQSRVDLSQVMTDEERLQIALSVAQSFGDILVGSLKVRAVEESAALHRKLREQTDRRIAEGASPDSDHTLVESRLQQVLAQKALIEAQRQASRLRLRQLVGRDVGPDEAGAGIVNASFPSQSADALILQAQAVNPGLARFETQIRLARLGVSGAKAQMMPDVYLRLERQYGNFSVSGLPAANRAVVGVTTRFGAGLSSFSAIQASQQRVEGAIMEREVAGRDLEQQIRSDLNLADASAQRIQSLQDVLKASEDIQQSWNRQFLVGRKTWIDVMNAARERLDAELQLADARGSLLVVSWRLALLTKRLSTLVPVNDGQ